MLLLFPTTCSLINLQCQISERVQGVRQRCQILISREVLINMGSDKNILILIKFTLKFKFTFT